MAHPTAATERSNRPAPPAAATTSASTGTLRSAWRTGSSPGIFVSVANPSGMTKSSGKPATAPAAIHSPDADPSSGCGWAPGVLTMMNVTSSRMSPRRSWTVTTAVSPGVASLVARTTSAPSLRRFALAWPTARTVSPPGNAPPRFGSTTGVVAVNATGSVRPFSVQTGAGAGSGSGVADGVGAKMRAATNTGTPTWSMDPSG